MAVKLRLRRMGRKKRPYYRIVATDSRMPRDGRFLETVGTYDPLETPHKIELKEDRIYYWLGNGAQPSQTVKDLFRHKGLWLKWDLMKNGADEAKIAQEFAKWKMIQEEKAKRLADKKAQAEEEKKEAAASETETEKEEAAVSEEVQAETKDATPATDEPVAEVEKEATEESAAEKKDQDQAGE